jgi:hypothetical protein
MFGVRILSEARSTAGPEFSSRCCFGSPKFASGNNDHDGGCQQDDCTEDQESCRARRGLMSRESWLIEASKLAWKIATSSTMYPVRL